MKKITEQRIIFHGSVIFMVGLLAGLPFGAALSFEWGEEAKRAWGLAHSAGTSAGLITLVSALLVSRLLISEANLNLMGRSFIASGYGFTLGMWLAAAAGERGALPFGSMINVLVLMFYTAGVVGSFIGATILLKSSMATSTTTGLAEDALEIPLEAN